MVVAMVRGVGGGAASVNRGGVGSRRGRGWRDSGAGLVEAGGAHVGLVCGKRDKKERKRVKIVHLDCK
jgi:hypothetical protein